LTNPEESGARGKLDQAVKGIRETGENIRRLIGEQESETRHDSVLTEAVERLWLETEPNFTKRIATPLHTRRRVTCEGTT